MLDLIYTVLMMDIIVLHTQAAVAKQLHSAACDGDIATLRRILTKGHVDVNITDEVGVSSPLSS